MEPFIFSREMSYFLTHFRPDEIHRSLVLDQPNEGDGRK